MQLSINLFFVFIFSGGFWNSIPFNDSAQPQSDVPALNKPCTFDHLYNNTLTNLHLMS